MTTRLRLTFWTRNIFLALLYIFSCILQIAKSISWFVKCPEFTLWVWMATIRNVSCNLILEFLYLFLHCSRLLWTLFQPRTTSFPKYAVFWSTLQFWVLLSIFCSYTSRVTKLESFWEKFLLGSFPSQLKYCC